MMTDEIRNEAWELLSDQRALSHDYQRAYLQLVACKKHVSTLYSAMMGSATHSWRDNQRKYEQAAAKLGGLEALFEDRCYEAQLAAQDQKERYEAERSDD